jgi:hypothetical protein
MQDLNDAVAAAIPSESRASTAPAELAPSGNAAASNKDFKDVNPLRMPAVE